MDAASSSTYLRDGNTAVITGASSGIGRAVAKRCASLGMNVYLADVDEAELTGAVDVVRSSSPRPSDRTIEGVVCDVSDPDAVSSIAERVFEESGACHLLMNNAGTGAGGGAMTDAGVVSRVMGVNAHGPIHGCLSFVPRMRESGEPGLIVNTGSKQGITMPPGNLTYNVSKAALKAYTEGLEHELAAERREEGGKLRAALLVPGWVNTSIFLKAMREKAKEVGEKFDVDKVFFHEDKPAEGAWMPDQIVDFMMEELDKGRFYIICPDNDVDRETDNLRMMWTMGDIVNDRPPLSRWHPDYKDEFEAFLAANKRNNA